MRAAAPERKQTSSTDQSPRTTAESERIWARLDIRLDDPDVPTPRTQPGLWIAVARRARARAFDQAQSPCGISRPKMMTPIQRHNDAPAKTLAIAGAVPSASTASTARDMPVT